MLPVADIGWPPRVFRCVGAGAHCDCTLWRHMHRYKRPRAHPNVVFLSVPAHPDTRAPGYLCFLDLAQFGASPVINCRTRSHKVCRLRNLAQCLITAPASIRCVGFAVSPSAQLPYPLLQGVSASLSLPVLHNRSLSNHLPVLTTRPCAS